MHDLPRLKQSFRRMLRDAGSMMKWEKLVQVQLPQRWLFVLLVIGGRNY